MPKLFIFDLDDTLAHLWVDWNGAVKREILDYAASDGLALNPEDGIVDVAEKASNTPERKRAVDAIFSKYEGKCIDGMDYFVYAQVPEMLRELRRRGHRVAVASNNTLKTIQAVVEGGEFGVDAIRGRDTVKRAKPNPEMIFSLMDELRSGREDVVFVGDSATDIGAGKAAEVRTIIVRPGEIDLKKVLGI
ncbi:MAG TPA: HAD family hydrolase [Candidatus Bilamarchaeaceae archaeon]|nr:HAD family hydrolase [Candidatus Bilamarchaeaceae archaeon]